MIPSSATIISNFDLSSMPMLKLGTDHSTDVSALAAARFNAKAVGELGFMHAVRFEDLCLAC